MLSCITYHFVDSYSFSMSLYKGTSSLYGHMKLSLFLFHIVLIFELLDLGIIFPKEKSYMVLEVSSHSHWRPFLLHLSKDRDSDVEYL